MVQPTGGATIQDIPALACVRVCLCVSLQERKPIEVKVSGCMSLQSPFWNQSRPWLTGSWVMSRPPGFVQEAGGSAGSELVPPLMDLGQLPEATAECLLVDDLLTVMMGQVSRGCGRGGGWQQTARS